MTEDAPETPLRANRYGEILAALFASHYKSGETEFTFRRDEITQIAAAQSIQLPKNLGDLIYSFRYRTALPDAVLQTAPEGYEWVIEGGGRSVYRFKLVRLNRILPSVNREVIKIPDATPQIVLQYALGDEQALLAKVRYNRLIDLFLRITAHSLQNHLRTTAKGIGQVEVDELYVGVRNTGQQFVVPIQAKGGKDQISTVQIRQDMALCREKFPALTLRPVAVQFKKEAGVEVIVMFEVDERDGDIKVVDERHYQLVLASAISSEDLKSWASRSD